MFIYQTKSGALELRGDSKNETVWATQAQIADVFEIDRTVATKHINNILSSSEVDINNNVQKMHIANSKKPVSLYSLDMILAVGYRTNSAKAIEFRQWSTKILRQHIVSGYNTINRTRVAKNYDEFMATIGKLQAVMPTSTVMDPKTTLDLVRLFADTWFSLDAYDKESLAPAKVNKKKVKLTAEELYESIVILKTELMRKGEASSNFAQAT